MFSLQTYHIQTQSVKFDTIFIHHTIAGGENQELQIGMIRYKITNESINEIQEAVRKEKKQTLS